MTDFWKTAQAALKNLQTQQGQPLQILMSGGTQSLLLAEILRTAKIEFNSHIFSFSYRNSYDIESAIQFCKSHEIAHQIHEFDFSKFINQRYLKISDRFPWVNLQMALLIDFQETLKMKSISAAFLPKIFVKRAGVFHATGISKEIIPAEYQELFFFQVHDEVRTSWIQHPRMSEWKELQPVIGFDDTRDWRETLIRADWKDFKSPIPWTGYEAFHSDIRTIESLRRSSGTTSTIVTQDVV